MKTRLGTVAYWLLLKRHNELFEQICNATGCGELKHTGDGYFAIFDVPSKAVQTALLFQEAMRQQSSDQPLSVRIGIAWGQVASVEMAGRADVIGLAADLASRVMSLAIGGQILMTREVETNSRQFVKEHPRLGFDGEVRELAWMAHGLYRVKGRDEALEVFEVGAKGLAPLTPPRGGVFLTDWRPRAGEKIPTQGGWELVRKLGEGGFGEVWLARNEPLRRDQVFKFCFDPERLRSFRRELLLFNTIRDKLGDRGDIAQLTGVQLDEPPYLLASEYAAGGNLAEWAEEQGGLGEVALPQRLEIFERIAGAVSAAHSVGVLHKDIKPENILMQKLPDGTFQPRISDFGIGFVCFPGEAEARAGARKSGSDADPMVDSEGTGALMYSPPEVLADQPFTMKGDVYALGVMLYQFVVGDLRRPLAAGWERDVDDELLRELINECVEGHVERRLSSATSMVKRLRGLEQQRSARELARLSEKRQKAWNRKVRRIVATLAGTTLVAMIIAGWTAWYFQRREANFRAEAAERYDLQRRYLMAFNQDMLSAANPDRSRGRELRVVDLMKAAVKVLDKNSGIRKVPEIEAILLRTVGDTFRRLGEYSEAEPLLRRALSIRIKIATSRSADQLDLAQSYDELGQLLQEQGFEAEQAKDSKRASDKYDEAARNIEEGLSIRNRERPNDRSLIMSSKNNLGEIYRDLKKLDEAERLLRSVYDYCRESADLEAIATIACTLGTVLEKKGEYDGAKKLYEEALSSAEARWPKGHWRIGKCQSCLACCLEKLNRPDDAAVFYAKAVEMWKTHKPPYLDDLALTEKALAKLNGRVKPRDTPTPDAVPAGSRIDASTD